MILRTFYRINTDFIDFFFSQNIIKVPFAPFANTYPLKNSLQNLSYLGNILRIHFIKEVPDNVPPVWLQFLVSGHNLGIFFNGIVVQFLDLCFAEDYILEERDDFFHWKVVRVSRQFMKEIDIFVENETNFRLQDRINQKFDMLLLEYMGNFLE